MKSMIYLVLILFVSCTHLENKSLTELKGIWIPKNINWLNGDFDTYFFLNDSSVMIISSVQKKINDSIYFNTEGGFNIMKGTLSFSLDDTIHITAHTIYQFIKRTDLAGNAIKPEASIVLKLQKGSTKSIMLNNVAYVPAVQYTKKSKKNVIDIATKMIPEIEKHPQ